MAGFTFRETMEGTWTRDGVARPMRFTAVARAGSLWRYALDRRVILAGEVTIEGLATARPLAGHMIIDPLLGRRIGYEFTFDGDDGGQYRFAGQKDVSVRAPVASMTTLPGAIWTRDAGGGETELATAQLTFDLAGLRRFLGTWRIEL